MAHKTRINGTIYDVQGRKCRVNGTGYEVKKGRTLIGGTGYDITFKPPYDPVFANNTWEQIIEACHNNEVPDTWKVADQKPMTINGTDYLIDIIGKNHDDYSDGSGKAPLTFQLHDCYADTKQMNSNRTNVGGWDKCDMFNKHLPSIFTLMPTAVQSSIKEVKKRTGKGNQIDSTYISKNKLFLLSEIEIFGSATNTASGEGTQYDYYKKSGRSVKNKGGRPNSWWSRSPHINNSVGFRYVTSDGKTASYSSIGNFGVSFAFCF